MIKCTHHGWYAENFQPILTTRTETSMSQSHSHFTLLSPLTNQTSREESELVLATCGFPAHFCSRFTEIVHVTYFGHWNIKEF